MAKKKVGDWTLIHEKPNVIQYRKNCPTRYDETWFDIIEIHKAWGNETWFITVPGKTRRKKTYGSEPQEIAKDEIYLPAANMTQIQGLTKTQAIKKAEKLMKIRKCKGGK